MKIIRIIFFSLLALGLIACTAFFIFYQTFDTDQYLPQISQKASLALGRPVSIGGVGLGLSSRGITLDVGPVTIADDSAFTSQPFIKIDRVRISLDLRSLFFRRDIKITSILLQSPQIHFIRSQEGNINIGSLWRQSSRSTGDNTAVAGEAKPSVASSPPHQVKTIERFVRSIELQGASISFIDQSHAFPMDIWLTDINGSLKGFSLSKPFQLSFDASLYSSRPNVHASTLMSLDLSKRSIQISDLKLDTDLSGLDTDRLKGISPDFSDNPVIKDISGKVQLNMAHLDIGAFRDLTANGEMNVTDGVIKNFDPIKIVLSHIPVSLPGMDGIVDKLGVVDTIINKAQVQFSLHDKAIFIDQSLVQTNVLELTATGSVDQGLNVDMQTMLHLNNDISATLVNEIDGLKYFCDDSKRIAIGASLKGIVPHLKYKPNKDFRKRSKKAFMEEGGNILGALLGGGKI